MITQGRQVVCDYLGPLAHNHQRPMPWEEGKGGAGLNG